MASEDYRLGFDTAGECARFALILLSPYPDPATDFEHGYNAGLTGLAKLITPDAQVKRHDAG
jgi:hypothetical protein